MASGEDGDFCEKMPTEAPTKFALSRKGRNCLVGDESPLCFSGFSQHASFSGRVGGDFKDRGSVPKCNLSSFRLETSGPEVFPPFWKATSCKEE